MENENTQSSETFDASQFELEDTAWLDVQNLRRTGDLLNNGKPVRVQVYSPGSKQGVKALHRAGMASVLSTRAMFSGKNDKGMAQQADEDRTAKLVMITASIENFPYPGGAQALYANQKLRDIGDQVEAFFNEKSNFSKASTPT